MGDRAGGMDAAKERRALSHGAHIVVGTPGRLRDHLERGALRLSSLRVAVLDVRLVGGVAAAALALCGLLPACAVFGTDPTTVPVPAASPTPSAAPSSGAPAAGEVRMSSHLPWCVQPVTVRPTSAETGGSNVLSAAIDPTSTAATVRPEVRARRKSASAA